MPKTFRCEAYVNPKAGLLQGALDMLILKALSLGPLHGYGVIQRIRRMSDEMLTVEQGALYPARISARARCTAGVLGPCTKGHEGRPIVALRYE